MILLLWKIIVIVILAGFAFTMIVGTIKTWTQYDCHNFDDRVIGCGFITFGILGLLSIATLVDLWWM
jgi:hypothetical protein